MKKLVFLLKQSLVMKAVIVPKNNTKTLPGKITKENMHLFPKDVQDFCALLEKDKSRIFSPEKYLPSQKSMVLKKVRKIHIENSETSLRQVLIRVLSDLPDFLPGDNLLLVSEYVVEEWRRLQEKKIIETV